MHAHIHNIYIIYIYIHKQANYMYVCVYRPMENRLLTCHIPLNENHFL